MTEDDAKTWVKNKTNQDKVVEKFFKDYKPNNKRTAFFMAGIPGAGKTEFAENTITKLESTLIPLEHDKLVTYIDGYTPESYYTFRKAGSILVTRIFEECIKNGYAFIFDGTLSHKQGHKNIQKALDSGYFVQTVYIRQSAQTAWELTKDRELVTKRGIERDGFIDTCNKINKNLLAIFQDFKDRTGFGLWIINKNGHVGFGEANFILYDNYGNDENANVEEVENALNITYSVDQLT